MQTKSLALLLIELTEVPVQAHIDSLDGRLTLDMERGLSRQLYLLIADLPPIERRVLRWLYGIRCEELPPEEIADRMNMTTWQVWETADKAAELIAQLVLVELAA